jgi:tetratricopeptide (TPR) repeat protein
MSEVEALCAEAVRRHQAGQLGDAERLYGQVLQADPAYLTARHLLGVLHHQQGRNDEALALLTALVAEHPDAVGILSNLGAVLKTMGRSEEALAIYQRVLALQPDHAAALNGRGAVLLDANRYDDALAAYDAALAAQPDFATALANRGRALQFLGRFDEARADLVRAMALAPDNTAVCLDYAETTTMTADDPVLARLEALAARDDMPVAEHIQVAFALGKAHADLKDERRSFAHLLRGNTLKRAQVVYDEAESARFFRRITDVFTPELLRRKHGMGGASRRPIFILGMMRSGSTLVEQILASHAGVHGAGELPAFTRIAAATLAYPEGVTGLDGAKLQEIAQRYDAELARLAPGAARITDKMPSNFVWAGLIHLAFPNAAIIHTVRDPLDTCVSCFSKLFTEDHPYVYDLGELGRFYRRYEALMAHWHAVLPPGRILDVRYEDVVGDIETQARRIIGHCGLDWDERCLAFQKHTRPIRTASLAQVRQPLYATAVGRARAYDDDLGPLKAALATSASI